MNSVIKKTILAALICGLATQSAQASLLKWSSLGAGLLASAYALFSRSSMTGSGFIVASALGACAGAITYGFTASKAITEPIKLNTAYETFKDALTQFIAKDTPETRAALLQATRAIGTQLNSDFFKEKRKELVQLAKQALPKLTKIMLAEKTELRNFISELLKKICN